MLTHNSCKCGAQFCYICGLRWKSCRCNHWDEDRLLARAEQIVRREVDRAEPRLPGIAPPIIPAVPEPVAAAEQAVTVETVAPVHDYAVRHMAENLRVNHNCETHNWRYISASSRCEECHHWMPQFIFDCSQCHLRVCRRCRRNRL